MAGTDHVLDTLRQAARDIRRVEAEAREALYGAGDKDRHRALLAEKCEILADLPGRVEPLLAGAGSEGARIKAACADFARRANQALDLESVFYMGALLYPDDYTDGQPNDLERFLDDLAKP